MPGKQGFLISLASFIVTTIAILGEQWVSGSLSI